jgi:hypothetical protein
MSKPTKNTQHEQDLATLATLAAGGYTGWWDETGSPAPWPDDFFNTNTEWRPATSTPTRLAHGDQPF